MPISPEELSQIVSIPVEAARLILHPPPGIDEEDYKRQLEGAVLFTKEQRSWVWEIHKNCDSLLHQRLSSFRTAQSMTLASFTVLTVARFSANPALIAPARIWLLDLSRVGVGLFGLFLAIAGFYVSYPMFKRLKYLNERFLFPNDPVYRDYYDCIKWDSQSWSRNSNTKFRFEFYRDIIPKWLPLAEGALWVILLGFLAGGIVVTAKSAPLCPQQSVNTSVR